MNHDDASKKKVLDQADSDVAEFYKEVFGDWNKNNFWTAARNKFPKLVDELIEIRRLMQSEVDVQQYTLKTKQFAIKSRDLIRRVGIQIKVFKNK